MFRNATWGAGFSVFQIHQTAELHNLALEEFMKKPILLKKSTLLLAGLAACGYLHVPEAFALDKTPPQQITFQFSGVIPGTSTGNVTTDFPTPFTGTSLTDQSTRSGGVQAYYSYQFNKWTGAEAGYGHARYTQSYSNELGASSVQSDLRQWTTDFVFHIPDRKSRIHPYAVTGVGVLRFTPTENVNNLAGAASESRSAFIYGGGADFDIRKGLGIRADYRGFKFKAPDFELAELTTLKQSHISEPSIGVYFRFSKVSIGKKGHTGD
jgi:opacity protein-like surface antigen